MQTQWIDKSLSYDGSQLAPLQNYLRHGLLGDSIVSWVGPCDVAIAHMMDGEDVRAASTIQADCMLHLVLELFQFPLSSAVALQRLIGEILIQKISEKSPLGRELQRFGDDIYWGDKKLNVSIATLSLTSSLIHFGINIDNLGTPVETCCLNDFGILQIQGFADELMSAIQEEFLSMKRAVVKVRTF